VALDFFFLLATLDMYLIHCMTSLPIYGHLFLFFLNHIMDNLFPLRLRWILSDMLLYVITPLFSYIKIAS